MEKYVELANKAFQLSDDIKRLQSELQTVNQEWSVAGLEELGVKQGQQVTSEGATYIVDSRYGNAISNHKWLICRKIKKNGAPYANSCTIFRWDK
ncbi:hypothetical protein IFU02_020890 [Pantoea agglomerans]|uniref:hypothetical protein n=1 Tax=Enterobacter agglomerans TaxID=549 RepID=UPI00177E98D0|nr:hypothetical protein [Pantoea agglomerans]WVL84899.1 hypothetical protein IFU02_020890 [Pantoea agglomerans]